MRHDDSRLAYTWTVRSQVWESTFGLQPGDSALFINGLQADLDVYDVFTLLDTMKAEAKLMEGLNNLGVLVGETDNELEIVEYKSAVCTYSFVSCACIAGWTR